MHDHDVCSVHSEQSVFALQVVTYLSRRETGEHIEKRIVLFTCEFSLFGEVDANIPGIKSVYIHDDFKIY